jgi:Ca2+-binding RTX toxin-like protein
MSLWSKLNQLKSRVQGLSQESESQKSRGRKRSRSVRASRLQFESLEERNLLAGIFFDSGTGEVTIGGSESADTASFVSTNATTYRASLTGSPNQTFSTSEVTKVIFVGLGGDDIFVNTTSVETLLLGGDGNDTLNGGSGIDTMNGGNGNDRLVGGDGEDRLIGLNGDDTIIGGNGNDKLFGGEGVNNITGNDGDDLMFGGGDVDTMNGGNGADQIFPLGGDDIINLGEGGTPGASDPALADLALGGAGNDTFTAGGGLNVMYGGDGNDIFNGSNGENRMHGQNGNDELNSGSGNDYLAGQVGEDTINAGSGNDFILPGFNDDIVNAGAGNDFVVFTTESSDYLITQDGATLFVDDKRDVDGTDEVTGAESFRFRDGDQPAAPSFTQRVVVRPIIVSNSNGSNTAEFFGNAASESEIKQLIDEIYIVAGIDVVWEAPQTYNNTFANVGNSSSRPQNDLVTVVNNGDAAGKGSSNPLVIDMYFVEKSAGFNDTGEDFANGLAYVDDSGVTIHIGDNLVGFEAGRAVVARVTAHELAHNLGLDHISTNGNLMKVGTGAGTTLTQAQINVMRNSRFTVDV